MTLTQLLRILLARKGLILRIFLLVFLTDAAVTFLLPKKYTAVATVLSDPRLPDPVYGYLAPNYGAGDAGNNAGTQVDIITSDRVGRRVVSLLGLDKDPDARAEWLGRGEGKGTIEQYYSDWLLYYVDVRPGKDSDVIDIQFTDRDPAFAANVVNAFAKAYVETALQLRTDPARASSSFFDARTSQLRAEVEKAQARLSEFQRTHGVSATDERLDVENSRLTDLGAQLTAIQAMRAESRSRESQAINASENSPDVSQNPVVQQLRTDISHAESKVDNLRKVYGARHPQLQSAQAELDSLNAKLQSEMQRVATTVRTTNTVNEQKADEIRAALLEQQRKVVALRADRDQAVVLQKDLEEAQKAYDLVAQRRSQTNLESLNQQANVAVLSDALPPTLPSKPRILLNLALGLAVGALLGMCTALAKEHFDRRVRGPEDVDRSFGLPILASLPSARSQKPGLAASGTTRKRPRLLAWKPAQTDKPGAA